MQKQPSKPIEINRGQGIKNLLKSIQKSNEKIEEIQKKYSEQQDKKHTTLSPHEEINSGIDIKPKN